MVIIGFDLSLSNTGWAVLEVEDELSFRVTESGYIHTCLTKKGKKYSTGSRLAEISKQMKNVLERHNADHIVKESSFSNGNIKSTQQIFKVVGVFEMLLHQSNKFTFTEYAPATVKKTITGNGRSSKEEVASEIEKLTSIKSKNDNITDAAGVALTYAIKNKLIVL